MKKVKQSNLSKAIKHLKDDEFLYTKEDVCTAKEVAEILDEKGLLPEDENGIYVLLECVLADTDESMFPEEIVEEYLKGEL